LVGEFARPGSVTASAAIPVNDHDFPSAAAGVVIPHGIYDVTENRAYITIGTSRDTSEFASDNFLHYWQEHLRHQYANATEILLLCDGGGSNHCRHHLVKEDFQRVVDSIGIPIRFAHYPAYCSKYNPIEHRLFPHVSRACAGAVFRTVSVAEECIAKTTTSKGLSVTLRTTETEYKTKRQVADDFHDTKNIVHDDHLGRWNYVIYPRKV
jgi:hypothetical protein